VFVRVCVCVCVCVRMCVHAVRYGIMCIMLNDSHSLLVPHPAAVGNLDAGSAPIHPILRYCVTTFLWLVIAGFQYAFRHFFYHRYVEDKGV